MPPVSPIHTRRRLAEFAQFGHDATADHPGAHLLLYRSGHRNLALGQWPIPAWAPHPADPLVGYLAPASAHAVGLVAQGAVSGADRCARPVRATVVLDRSAQMVTILEPAGEAPQIIDEPAQGWVADALRRTLGIDTAAPTERIAQWVEVAWLDGIASQVLESPGCLRSWSAIAELHPLHPSGPALPPALLAVEAEAIDLESSWSRIRRLVGRDSTPEGPVPPDGLNVDMEHWFDDGSFSRWVQRNQPPPGPILAAVLDALPVDLGAQLLDALITVAPS